MVYGFESCYDKAMKLRYPLEPGVLSAFRLMSGVRFVLIVLSILLQVFRAGWPASQPYMYWISLASSGLLLGYLLWSHLEQILKQYYLIIGVAIATLGPILEQYAAISFRLINPMDYSVLISAWQLIPVLFIPLVVLAWQYDFNTVVKFCVSTILLDAVAAVILVRLVFSSASSLFLPFQLLGVELIRMISYLIVGWLVVTLMDGQRTQRSELELANSRLSQYATTLEQLTLSRERNRMARELHDILAHTLSGVAVELEAVRALWDAEPDRARAMLGNSLASTREGLTETRRALQALRASPLEDIGLGLAVCTQAESTAARLGLDLTLEIDETLGELSPDVEQCFYRIAQEALTNVAQHAGARRIRLVLTQRDGTLRLEVSDDGRGFDLYQVDQDSQFGLQGMRERAEMIGADFTLNTIPGEGTSITLIYGGGHDTTADL